MLQCPVPGCGHVGEMFTHNHATTHGFANKQALIKEHGEPLTIQLDGQMVKKNLKLYSFPTTINRQYHGDKVSRAERKARRDRHEGVV